MLQLGLKLLFIAFLPSILAQQSQEWAFACSSLVCEPPKMCIVKDEVAQCLYVLQPTPPTPQAATTTKSFLDSIFSKAPESASVPTLPPFPALGVSFPTTVNQQAETTTVPTTPPSPFAPFLSLFGTGPPPIALPTLSPPTTTTTKSPSDICQLPPITGHCSMARIMWYFDTETGKCERFSFSGCGNENRFPSRVQCEQTCQRFLRAV